MFLCPRCCRMSFILVLQSCNSSAALLVCRTYHGRRKNWMCTCPSVLLVKSSNAVWVVFIPWGGVGAHILSVIYFPIMCEFSGVAYLKMLVRKFLIFKECIVGKHPFWSGTVSSITRCCRKCKLCICLMQQFTYVLQFLQPHVSHSCLWWVKNESFVKPVLLNFYCRQGHRICSTVAQYSISLSHMQFSICMVARKRECFSSCISRYAKAHFGEVLGIKLVSFHLP